MKVQFYQDDTYEVYTYDDDEFISLYQGSLADCQAYIWLSERSYL